MNRINIPDMIKLTRMKTYDVPYKYISVTNPSKEIPEIQLREEIIWKEISNRKFEFVTLQPAKLPLELQTIVYLPSSNLVLPEIHDVRGDSISFCSIFFQQNRNKFQ